MKDPGLIQSLVHVIKKESQGEVPDYTLNPKILSAQTIQGALPTVFLTPTTQIYFYHI